MNIISGGRKKRPHPQDNAAKSKRRPAVKTATGDSQTPEGEASRIQPPKAAEQLAAIGLSLDLWHDSTQAGFATIGRQSHPIRSRAFRHFLTNEYRKNSGGKVPGGEAISAALNAIEGAAVHDGPEYPVFVRVAGAGAAVYFHLADAASTVIEVDKAGWRVCESPPVRFRKPAGMLPLPMPKRGCKIMDLRQYLNVPDLSSFALVVGWLMGAFRPDGPFPLLVLLGEQGSAKTTTGRVLKKLIDPSKAPDRAEPRNEQDLMIRARHNWVLGFDNLSGLPPWLSDALCRLATGGGFSTRALYTDDDEVIFDSKRPQVVNGIEDFVTRADLLERSLLIRHPPIPEERRRTESEFWAAFQAAHPKLLGAVLDRVSAGMRALPDTKLDRHPRMADFALFAVACERGSGGGERFLAAYAENQAGAHEQALDASPLPAAVLAVMAGKNEWEGSAAELLAALDRHSPVQPPRDWPKKPNVLTNKLRRLAPNLRRVHRIDVDCDGRQSGGRSAGKRSRMVRIERLPEATAAAPSPPSPCREPDPEDRAEHSRTNGRGAAYSPTEQPNHEAHCPGDDGDGGDDRPQTFSPRRRYKNRDLPYESRGSQ